MEARRPIREANAVVKGRCDRNKKGRGINSFNSPAIWELESQLLRDEAPKGGHWWKNAGPIKWGAGHDYFIGLL